MSSRMLQKTHFLSYVGTLYFSYIGTLFCLLPDSTFNLFDGIRSLLNACRYLDTLTLSRYD